MKQQLPRKPLVHLPLEPYQSRYTADLRTWELHAFSACFNVVTVVPPDPVENEVSVITSGEVLDSVRRPKWALQQLDQVLNAEGPYLGNIFCSDFYTPGLDALAYSRKQFSAYSFLWAQTFDQFDFTHRLFTPWMRPWEVMAFEIYKRVYVASNVLKDLIVSALPYVADKVQVTGLPYNHRQVFGQLRSLPSTRNFDVAYAGRWDTEKNPDLFLDLLEGSGLKGVVCTGQPRLIGTARAAIERALAMVADGRLTLLSNLTRADYFNILASSQTLFNCASQDWISYTLLDALTFGCMPMYPIFRSFPEALLYEQAFLYIPGDTEDAARKISDNIQDPPSVFPALAAHILGMHDSALNLIAQDIYAQP